MRTVSDIMATDIITVHRDTPVRELVELLSEEGVSGVPVLDEGRKVVGVVSQTDVVRLAAEPVEGRDFTPAEAPLGVDPGSVGGDEEWPESFFSSPEEWGFLPESAWAEVRGSTFDDSTVAEIMTPVAYAVSPEMTIWEAARFMAEGRIHRALVVDDNVLVGIVTTFDILRVVAGDAEN